MVNKAKRANLSEDHYQYLFDDAPIGIYRSNREGKLIDANKALVEMLGFADFESLAATNVATLYLDPQDRQQFLSMLERTPKVVTHIYRLRRLGGEIICVRNTARAIRNEAGELVYFQGVIEDITERVEAQSELQIAISRVQSERAQRELAETLREVANTITSTLDLEEVLQKILDNLHDLVSYDRVALVLQEDQQLIPVAIRNRANPPLKREQSIHLRDNPLWRQIIETQQPATLENVVFDSGSQNNQLGSSMRSWMGVPLIRRGKPIGLISIESETANAYQRREIEIVFALATQAAIAIDNARLFAQEKLRANLMSALRATLADITSELDIRVLLQSILERAIELLNATGGELGLYDDQQGLITIVACHNMGRDFTGAVMRAGFGALGKVAVSGEPLLIPDYQTWDGHLTRFQEMPWRSVLAVPLESHNRTLGVVALAESTGKFHFTQTDLRTLTLFAQQAAVAIENARLFDQITSALKNTQTLYQTAQALITTENLGDLLNNLVAKVASILPARRVILVTLDTETQTIKNYVIGGEQSHREPVSYQELMDGLTGWVMREGQTALSHYARPDPREKPYVQEVRSAEQIGSLIVAPLQYRQKALGTLTAIHAAKNHYSNTDVELLETIASHAAIAITNAQLFEEIQELAKTDDLTKVNNRRQLFKLGEQAFNHAKRYNEAFSVLMFDIDNFKQINDTYGHAMGDVVLHDLAQYTLKNIRAVDILGRYGGEEFVIILPQTSLREGLELAERLRRDVENMSLSTSAGLLNTTISVGIAELTSHTPNLAALIDYADTALYQAKNTGRNRIATFKKSGKAKSK